MQTSLWTAFTGLVHNQRGLDVTSNNISNTNTTGFKGSNIRFKDIFSQTIKQGGDTGQGTTTNSLQKGMGVDTAAIQKDFRDGTPEFTGFSTDIALQGPGFFILRPSTGINRDPIVTRSGHFSIDANAGAAPQAGGVPSQAGPIRLVSPEGFTLQGVNAALDAATGEFVLNAAAPDQFEDIEFDPAGTLGPFATTRAEFGFNLDSRQAVAIDPIALEMSNLGVDQSVRIEFQRASAEGNFFFFTVQDPAQDPVTKQFTTEVDGVTGQDITGVVELDDSGNIVAVFENTDADAWLTQAEVQALTPWANVAVNGNPIFTVGEAPAGPVAGEQATTGQGAAINLTTPDPLNLSGAPDPGSLSLTLDGTPLVENVDYTLAGSTVTPTTAWYNSRVSASYTTNGGAATVAGETFDIANVQAVQSFRVANAPIQAGTLTVNATRGGAALVEGTDYTVNENEGTVSPLTFWDAGNVTVDYTPADARITVEHNIAGMPIAFRNNQIPGSGVGATVRSAGDIIEGTAMSAFDSLGNEHSLAFSFERLSDNRWSWKATPTYREGLDTTAVIDSAQGGGTTQDGTTVLPNTLIPSGGDKFNIKLQIDEGSGPQEWSQIPSAANFPDTSGSSRFFKVVDPATGELAFSRDVDTTNTDFQILAQYESAVTTGDGIVAFDAQGLFDSTNSTTFNPVEFTPQGAALVAITPDFSGLNQAARQSDATVVSSDGFGAGQLSTWNFDDSGRIVAEFSNGKTQFLGRVAIARNINSEGNQALGENAFANTIASGDFTFHFAGPDSDIGARIVPRSLESSNVDMSLQMTDLILFQRAYQFNSRIVTTTDEMLQEAIGMKR